MKDIFDAYNRQKYFSAQDWIGVAEKTVAMRLMAQYIGLSQPKQEDPGSC